MKVRASSLLVSFAAEAGRSLAFLVAAVSMIFIATPNFVAFGPKSPAIVSGAAVACALASIVAALGFRALGPGITKLSGAILVIELPFLVLAQLRGDVGSVYFGATEAALAAGAYLAARLADHPRRVRGVSTPVLLWGLSVQLCWVLSIHGAGTVELALVTGFTVLSWSFDRWREGARRHLVEN